MAFFAMQYRVLFHDTMAYGTHHHMTNLKFQNLARETILFESGSAAHGSWQEQLKDIVILTREAYSLNLAPVALGGRVGILMTYEAPTRSTVRLCFRVVREDGQPVSCGYQTLILMHRDTYELVPAPPLLAQYLGDDPSRCLLEPLTSPSFAERLQAGPPAVRAIFTEEVCRLGAQVASAPHAAVSPGLIDPSHNEDRLHGEVAR